MKKTLRSIALAALAVPMIASAQFKVETIWMNGVVEGKATPIEGLDAGWGKPTASNPGTASVSRFAVGKDGKIYTTSHKDNAIISYDGTSTSIVAKVSPVTVLNWDGNSPIGAPGARWNGTAITTDDAGHIVFNYCFIQAASVQKWGMVNEDGSVTDVDLATPLEDILNPTRLDIISHIVGDVTSEKGGIGYSTTKGTDHILMFHFKGDGSKVTSVTAKASLPVDGLAAIYGASVQTETYQAAPKYLTIDEILNTSDPENQFYLPVGKLGATSETVYGFETGLISNFNGNVFAPIIAGNRGYGSVATFALGGKKYIVRYYVAPDSPNDAVLTNWKNVMAFGIFDEDGNCCATWEGSTFSSGFGSGTITAETVDDSTVNIYVYAATGNADEATGTLAGNYAAMLKLTTSDAPVVGDEPNGSEANPYLIATAEDLCNAYKKTVEGKLVYFKQTADIDMAGVTDYTAVTGYDSNYNKSIYYDGDNHVIKNFAPVDRIAGTGENAYYDTSIFGTPSGTIKNLGVVDANIETSWFEAGILGGFAGTGAQTATTEMIVDNVFVTGKITTSMPNSCTGGMFGTQGQSLTITNSYAQVEIDGPDFVGGIIGKATPGAYDNLTITVENSYVSGSVKGAKTALVVTSSVSDPAKVTFNNVVAFGEGVASNIETTGTATVVPAGDAEGIATVQSWAAFNAGKLYNGLPALNWQDNATGISDITLDNENAPVEYYNLQGIRVNQPAAGSIVIKKQGSKTSKFIVR